MSRTVTIPPYLKGFNYARPHSLRLACARDSLSTAPAPILTSRHLVTSLVLLDPISVLLALTNKDLMKQSISNLFWGEGETALLAYAILVRYREWAKRTTEAADFSHERLTSYPSQPTAGPRACDTGRELL